MEKVDTLNYSWNLEDITAYIITLRGNDVSERLSKRCKNSCLSVGQKYEVWDAFDGTSGEIFYPEHLKDQRHFKWLKQMNDKLTITEAAAILSHYSLWCKCIEEDKPIVILEHDAVMVNPYTCHKGWNQINYLGCMEHYQLGKYPDFPIHAAATKNYRFICRAHAYAIDPAIARQLVSHLIRFGLTAPADMLMRVDIFNVVQTGFYAFDMPGETTILDRDPNWQEDAKEIISTFV